jgi:hypothetical protein
VRHLRKIMLSQAAQPLEPTTREASAIPAASFKSGSGKLPAGPPELGDIVPGVLLRYSLSFPIPKHRKSSPIKRSRCSFRS